MKWEYRREPIHMETWNALGKEGWELVSVEGNTAYFKRLENSEEQWHSNQANQATPAVGRRKTPK